MWYEILKIVVLVFGPVVVYTTLRATFEVPEMIASLPTTFLRTIQAVGGILMVSAWFGAYVGSLAGPMAWIGLMLLTSPLVARKLSQLETAYSEV